ncbi:MAG: hypothetical protein QOH51_3366 [Acidobacteriota bacterium]|jgi:hypothetical protein|nr:hypothetical protein [Acidobacteriota bacterium]
MKRLAPSLLAFILLSAPTHAARAANTHAPARLPFVSSARLLFAMTPSIRQGRNTRRKHTSGATSRPRATATSAGKPVSTSAGAGSSRPVQTTTPTVRLDDTVTNEPLTRPAGKTDDELAAEAFNSALNEALRKPLAGETRVRGVLTRIECVPEGLVFIVKAGDGQLRLSSGSFKEIHILAFTPDAGKEMSCGPRKRESQVVVTYRATPDAAAKTDGSLVALEFVPVSFQLKKEEK